MWLNFKVIMRQVLACSYTAVRIDRSGAATLAYVGLWMGLSLDSKSSLYSGKNVIYENGPWVDVVEF